MLRLTGGYEGLLFEYVHIKPGSCRVKEGDTVSQGQHLCDSGDVGFCPSPHLHIQAHAPGSDHRTAPTVPFRMRAAASGEAYHPRAGRMYNADGPVTEDTALYGLPAAQPARAGEDVSTADADNVKHAAGEPKAGLVEPEQMSVTALKALLRSRGVDISNAVEKEDLCRKVRASHPGPRR